MPVNACCCSGTPCIPGPLDCPDGMPSFRTVSVPNTINWGSAPSLPDTCVGGPSSVVVSAYAPCIFNWINEDSICVSGWVSYFYPGDSQGVLLAGDETDDGSCAVWLVLQSWKSADGLHMLTLWYKKPRAGAGIIDDVGVYTLWKITWGVYPGYTPVIIPDASADATITVSP